jgi:hypothetical protein
MLLSPLTIPHRPYVIYQWLACHINARLLATGIVQFAEFRGKLGVAFSLATPIAVRVHAHRGTFPLAYSIAAFKSIAPV